MTMQNFKVTVKIVDHFIGDIYVYLQLLDEKRGEVIWFFYLEKKKKHKCVKSFSFCAFKRVKG